MPSGRRRPSLNCLMPDPSPGVQPSPRSLSLGKPHVGTRRELILAGVALTVLLGCGGGAPGTAGETAARPGIDPAVSTSVPPEWSPHVAQLFYDNCVECHRPGGGAPFALLAYEDAARRADRIARATARRFMPPWLPTAGIGDFEGERRLSEPEIALLRQWAEAGAPEGDPEAAPPPPAFPSGWSLGEPDLLVEFPPHDVPAGGQDLYRNLVVHVPLDSARWIQVAEIRPGNTRVVHHAKMMTDTTPSSRDMASQEAQPGFDGMHVASKARNPDGFFVGWTPGKVPSEGRRDLAWRLTPGTDLVLQLHLKPTGSPEQVRATVGFYFADAAPRRMPALVMLESRDIDIAPGDTAFVTEERYRLPVPVEVLTIYPHAHYLGKRLEGWAIMPNGRRRDLIRIDDWDFNFQDEYRYRDPVELPAGTVITMHYTYDNSSANPQNPFDPPHRVTHGPQSTDEMAELVLQVLPADPSDLAALVEDLNRFYYQAGLRWEADQQRARARTLEAEGRLDEALEAYRQVLLMGEDARIFAAMAGLFLRKGEASGAVLAAERAVALAGGADARILGVLARAYAAAGRMEEAREVAQRGAEMARQSGQPALADSLMALRRSLGGG